MHRTGRRVFCVVAAVSAAALADPLVEAASNAGLFGRGNFTDHSTLDVLPASAAAATLAALYIFLRAAPLLGLGSRGGRRGWSAGLSAAWLRRTLPAIFGTQMIVLYAMETLEQIAVAGHPLGGALWLGGPVVAALAAHALACIVTVALLARGLDAVARAAVDAVHFVRSAFARKYGSEPVASTVLRAPRRTARIHPLARAFGERAPPFLEA